MPSNKLESKVKAKGKYTLKHPKISQSNITSVDLLVGLPNPNKCEVVKRVN